MDVKHVMKYHASQNIPLNFEEAYELGLYALRGCRGDELAKIQSIAMLSSLHNKATYSWTRCNADTVLHDNDLPQSAADQIAGICAAIFEDDIAKSEFGFLKADVPYLMDNCGMGGDIVVTANISTISAFIAAAAGIPMCKHGSPANADQGRHGSSDFLSLTCGINTFATNEEVARSIESFGFGYTDALDTRYKHIHLQTHEIAKMPHMNDIIGPITNPVDPTLLSRRIVGINHLISPRVVADAYLILNASGITHLDHGIFLRGFTSSDYYEGIDELSICDGGTCVVELKDGKVEEYYLYANDFGINPCTIEDISPIGPKGDYSMQILSGNIDGPRLDVVLANAAMLFYLAGKSLDLKECYKMAKAVFLSGGAYNTMLSMREMLPNTI